MTSPTLFGMLITKIGEILKFRNFYLSVQKGRGSC